MSTRIRSVLVYAVMGAVLFAILYGVSKCTGSGLEHEHRITAVTCKLAEAWRTGRISSELYVQLFVIRERAHEAFHRWHDLPSDGNAAQLNAAVDVMNEAVRGIVE